MEHFEPNIVAAMQAGDWQLVAELEQQLDQAARPQEPVQMVSAALWYASVGLKVFPLQPHTKIPYKGTRGLKEASSDRDTITAWWQKRPDSNVAIATGHLIDVIDIDGPEGVKAWARMRNLPKPIGTVHTPRFGKEPRGGGHHLYVTATGRGNKAAIFNGIDYRGQGGYVVAPPSAMPDGSYYYWRRPLTLETV